MAKKATKVTFDKELFKKEVENNVKSLFRITFKEADSKQIFKAAAYAVQDLIVDNWMKTQDAYEKEDPKTVYYLSMEFLMGRALGNNMINLQTYQPIKEALEEMGVDINVIEDQEPDAALGNGGLGRLAACFIDSLATLGYPAYGCGIRYRYGMFKQKIVDGYQIEVPDQWLKNGNPFELRRPEYAKEVKFGGYIETRYENGNYHFEHKNYQSVLAVPVDMPIVGYGNNIVNTLRVWDAEAITNFQLDAFNKGEYQRAVEQENLARNIVEVLYPNDNHYAGKELRLKQQYFLVSASLQNILADHKRRYGSLKLLPKMAAIHLNDTHPALAIPELMRLLIDENSMSWDDAWEITTSVCAYTNHTVLQEALERWPENLFAQVLPRIHMILQEMNRRLCAQLWEAYPGQWERIGKMAIIAYNQVHMANLCVAYTHSVNGKRNSNL